MTLQEYLADFVKNMTEMGHGSSWGIAGASVTRGGVTREERMFVFVSVDPDRIAAAQGVLGNAGLLCETPMVINDGTPVDPALAVHMLTTCLRRLSGRSWT